VKAVYALYDDGGAAQQAVNRLRAAGLSDPEITILSGRPMEEFEFGQIDRATWMWWIACGGGLVGLSTAAGLAWVTEMRWPMNVGGLPAWSWWPNLIIMFELTMLGAVIATVVTLVVSAGFGRGKDRLYDPAVSDGKILVGVENPSSARLDALQSALQVTSGVEIKTT
jgi:hypothetical protein